MKEKFAALLAVLLLLTGCGQKTQMSDVAVLEEPEAVEEEAPAAEEPDPAPEEKPAELPVEEPDPEIPACEDGVAPEWDEAQFELTVVEDLIEDAVAYKLDQPTFTGLNGADKINSFYADIILNLENFCKSQIFNEAMEKSCIADAYGILDFARIIDGELQVQYRFRAEFSDETERENVRIDYFDVETGDRIEK